MTGFLCSFGFVAWLFGSCATTGGTFAGYVEGDFTALSPVATARIIALHVKRGDRVEAGTAVADLEDEDARQAVAQARAGLAEARASLADIGKGKRPEEIAAIEASLESAKAQARQTLLALTRLEGVFAKGYAPKADLDKARADSEVAEARTREIEANLAVARLPARADQRLAAEERVAQASAALASAVWQLGQRRVTATVAGRVHDILRRPGETAGPAAPILSLLPDGALKVRFYVSQAVVSGISPGDRITAACDGCDGPMAAIVSFVAREAEFTPPVIYSLDSRQKLVYLVEARPAAGDSMLKPGQIVDVRLGAE